MELYLLRHGIAVEPGTAGFDNDGDRPLTSKGRRQLRKIAGNLKELDCDFDLILSSPLLRARQTAEIVADKLKLKKKLRICEALAPGGAARLWMRQLEREKPTPKRVLLVGHEPDLSSLVSLLLAGKTGLEVEFKKAGLCKLEADKLRAGKCAKLAWLLTPKQLKMIG
ncbi:MAG TPA: phosphohistidine phosphatase SixA [Verrucomicrobiae bacterium]